MIYVIDEAMSKRWFSFRICAMYEWYKAVVRFVHVLCTKFKRYISIASFYGAGWW